jgi:hypothetical protein
MGRIVPLGFLRGMRRQANSLDLSSPVKSPLAMSEMMHLRPLAQVGSHAARRTREPVHPERPGALPLSSLAIALWNLASSMTTSCAGLEGGRGIGVGLGGCSLESSVRVA